MGYVTQFAGDIRVDKNALGDRLDECQEDFASIWKEGGYCHYGYFKNFMVDTEGDFDNFQDCFKAFFEKWGEFVTDINIEAYGEDVDDCTRYWLRDGKILSAEGRMVFDQNETVW